MVFSLSIQAFAAEVEGEKQAVIRDEIVEIVSTASTTEERDRLLSELLEETPLASTVSLDGMSSYEYDELSGSILITGMPDIVESVEVDENTKIDFYETGEFGIMETENLGATNIAVPYSSSYKYTNTYRTSYTLKNVLGGKIVETYVKGYFKYDGSNTPTAYLEDAGYSKGTLIFWKCSSWSEGTKKKSSNKTAYCYADAYYDWTLDVSLGGSISGEIGGVGGKVSGSVSGGLTIQDCNVYLKLICSKSGTVSSSVSLEG